MDEKTILKIRAAAAGLPLTASRIEGLLPGMRRLDATARWLRGFDLEFSEPALVFDAQPGEGVDSE